VGTVAPLLVVLLLALLFAIALIALGITWLVLTDAKNEELKRLELSNRD
jgi:uncharacterized membrane protein HdeD (DUF308 family)